MDRGMAREAGPIRVSQVVSPLWWPSQIQITELGRHPGPCESASACGLSPMRPPHTCEGSPIVVALGEIRAGRCTLVAAQQCPPPVAVAGGMDSDCGRLWIQVPSHWCPSLHPGHEQASKEMSCVYVLIRGRGRHASAACPVLPLQHVGHDGHILANSAFFCVTTPA